MSSRPAGHTEAGMVPRLAPIALPRWLPVVLALVLYLGLAFALFSSAWRDPRTTAIGLDTDPIFSIWFLRWVPYAIGHGLNPLLTNYLDYPAGANLTWSGLFPLPALILSPLTLWLGPVVSYNLLATLALALSAWTGFLAVRRYVPSAAAATIGGLLYGFSPALVAQSLGHPQIAVAIIPPLMLLALDDILVRQHHSFLRSGALLGVLGAAQLLAGEELLAAEAIVAAAGGVLLIAANREAVAARAGYVMRATGMAAAVFIMLSAGPLAVQFLGPQRVVGGSLQPANVYVSDLINFIVPTSLQQFAPRLAVVISDQFSGTLSEWNAYMGLPLLGLLVLAAMTCRRLSIMRLSGLLTVLFSLLSLGVTVHIVGLVTPIPVGLLGMTFGGVRRWVPLRPLLYTFVGIWVALAIVPVVNNLLPGRLMLFVFLFAGILLAGLVDEASRLADRRRKALTLAAVVVALVLLLPHWPFPATQLATPPFFSARVEAVVPVGAVVLVAPYSRGGSTQAMLWQAESGMVFKMPEGYALIPGPRASPPATALGAEMAAVEKGAPPDLAADSLERMRRDLKDWRVQAVALGPMAHREEMVALFTRLLGRGPRALGGVQFWSDVGLSAQQ